MRELPLPTSGPLAERAGRAAPAALAARRPAPGATYAEQECQLAGGRWGTVRALRFNPAGAARGTVLHWHGGGFRLGSPEYAAPFASALAAACDVEVICPQYRLAPEHPFPAGINDGVAAIEGALALGVGRLILSGDSAGGGLAASLAVICAARGIPLMGVVLQSPWLDLTVENDCFRENAASDPFFSHEMASEAAQQYLQGHPATDPLASALFASVRGFPPTYQCVGTGEVLAADARAFHERLLGAGHPARLSLIEGMEHVAAMRGQDLTGAAQAFAEIADFVRARVSI